MKRAALLLCAAVLFGGLGSRLRGAETWGTQKIASNGCWASIAVEKSNVYLLWTERQGSHALYFTRSKNGGKTWLPAKTIARGVSPFDPTGIAAVGSAVYVVWVNEKKDIQFARSTDRGTSWKPAQKLCADKDTSFFPAIAVSGANIYVAWENFYSTDWSYSLYFRRSPDGGATWQPLQKPVEDANCHNLSLAASDKTVYLVWQDDHDSVCDVYFRKSVDGGAAWQAAQKLCSTPRKSEFPRIALAGSALYVAWQEQRASNRNGEIFLRTSADAGMTWQAARKMTGTSGESQNPALAALGQSVILAWRDDTKGNDEIYVRTSANGGAGWAAAERLTKTETDSLFPRVALSATSAYVLWVDGDEYGGDVYLSSAAR